MSNFFTDWAKLSEQETCLRLACDPSRKRVVKVHEVLWAEKENLKYNKNNIWFRVKLVA